MGGTISTGPSPLSERKKHVRKNKREVERQRKQDEARRKQLLETYGVLIPPVFLANKTDHPPLSSKVWERVAQESSSAQIPSNGSSDLLSWAYRNKFSSGNDEEFDDAGPLLGQTLLTEYMTPGLFLSLPVAASGANDGGRFFVALPQPSKDSTTSLPPFLSLTKCFHKDSSVFFPFPWKIETFLPQTALLPSSSSNNHRYSLPSSMRVVADLSGSSNKTNKTQVSWTTHFLDPSSSSSTPTTSTPSNSIQNKLQGSWIEAETLQTDWFQSGMNLRMASAMTLDCFLNQVVLGSLRAGNDAYGNPLGDFLRNYPTQATKDTVRLRMAAEYKESILASSTNLSLSSLFGSNSTSTPIVTNTDTLLSLNLNGGNDDEDATTTTTVPPPLWLTLQQTKGYTTPNSPSSFAITLSQVVTFDREIWNILEDRAPKVRNHLGLVCQIQRNQTSDSSSESVLSVGASAQFNRNLATKALFESKLTSADAAESSKSPPPSAALKLAVVLKRWLEPQASLSVIQKVDLLTGKWSFLGIGLEIEQNRPLGSNSSSHRRKSSSKQSNAEYRTTADIDASSSVAPPTKVRVELPHDKR